jgi:hypothetical protein
MLSQALVLALVGAAAAQAPSCTSFPLPLAETERADLGILLLTDAPQWVDCPATPLLERTGTPGVNQTLFSGERSYIDNRRENVLPQLWTDYLGQASTGDTGYTASQVVNERPKLCVLSLLRFSPRY